MLCHKLMQSQFLLFVQRCGCAYWTWGVNDFLLNLGEDEIVAPKIAQSFHCQQKNIPTFLSLIHIFAGTPATGLHLVCFGETNFSQSHGEQKVFACFKYWDYQKDHKSDFLMRKDWFGVLDACLFEMGWMTSSADFSKTLERHTSTNALLRFAQAPA